MKNYTIDTLFDISQATHRYAHRGHREIIPAKNAMRTTHITFTIGLIIIIGAIYWAGEGNTSITDIIPIATQSAQDIRPLVTEEINRAATTVTKENLDNYLSSLIKQAEEKGQATALEVQPGVERILTLTGNLEKLAEFTQRMQTINGAKQDRPSPTEAAIKVAELAKQIMIAEPESEALTTLIKQYTETAHYLTPEAEMEAIAQLNNIVPRTIDSPQNQAPTEHKLDSISNNEASHTQQPTHSPAATQEMLATLIQEIANTPDEAGKNQLIEQYIQLADSLPSEEQAILAITELQNYLPKKTEEPLELNMAKP